MVVECCMKHPSCRNRPANASQERQRERRDDRDGRMRASGNAVAWEGIDLGTTIRRRPPYDRPAVPRMPEVT